MQSITDFLTQLLTAASDGSLGIGQALVAVLIAYLGGILSSLTPCVYPMIPITVSVVGGMTGPATAKLDPAARRKTWRESLLRGLSYVLGMTLIYSFLGVAAGLTGKVFGSFTNTSGWYIGLGVVMTIAALIMLDVIPFDPMAWMDQLKRKFRNKTGRPHPVHASAAHREMTLLGAFALGASSGFIAAPCTTPVLTSILAYIAKTQSVVLGLALMTSFSLGLGTILLTIAAFAGAIQVLPKSGNWMKTIKILSGLLLLGFAEYLIYQSGVLGGP